MVANKPSELLNLSDSHPTTHIERAVRILDRLCHVAGANNLLNVDESPGRRKLLQAIERHDTPYLFEWLVRILSFQGISDRVASSYIDQHGSITWDDIQARLGKRARCSRLSTYWQFHGCGYDKTRQTCSEPTLFKRCPLPRHRLRNGRLNQMAYSLYLFIRDVAEGNLVGWLDKQLHTAHANEPESVARSSEALVAPLRNIFGVSDKVLAMALSDLLLAAPASKKGWQDVGVSLVAIDTLVHNFLHRTGILNSLGRQHAYGAGCYRDGGCAEIIRQISGQVDAKRFNAAYPAYFPRFVQHAIWRFCSAEALDVCNVPTTGFGRVFLARWAKVSLLVVLPLAFLATIAIRISAETTTELPNCDSSVAIKALKDAVEDSPYSGVRIKIFSTKDVKECGVREDDKLDLLLRACSATLYNGLSCLSIARPDQNPPCKDAC